MLNLKFNYKTVPGTCFCSYQYKSRVRIKEQSWNMIFFNSHETGSWDFNLTVYITGILRRLQLQTSTFVQGT